MKNLLLGIVAFFAFATPVSSQPETSEIIQAKIQIQCVVKMVRLDKGSKMHSYIVTNIDKYIRSEDQSKKKTDPKSLKSSIHLFYEGLVFGEKIVDVNYCPEQFRRAWYNRLDAMKDFIPAVYKSRDSNNMSLTKIADILFTTKSILDGKNSSLTSLMNRLKKQEEIPLQTYINAEREYKAAWKNSLLELVTNYPELISYMDKYQKSIYEIDELFLKQDAEEMNATRKALLFVPFEKYALYSLANINELKEELSKEDRKAVFDLVFEYLYAQDNKEKEEGQVEEN